MSTIPTYRFKRGMAVVLARELVSGDATGVTAVAKLKRVRSAGLPPASVAAVATLTPATVPAAGADPLRWTFTLAAAAADALPRGRYAIDVVYSAGGGVLGVSDPAIVVLEESVSG